MKPSSRLPPAEKKALQLGFMRLSDSAPLVLAKELGLFEEFGLDVELSREVSWANLRDRLVLGDLDAAQLLAPLPMMTSYGAGGMRANLLTGLSLSLNGNAITVSSGLWSELAMPGTARPPDPLLTARKLRELLATRDHKSGLTFATVHLFSMHTILLRMWLSAGGIDPDRDVRIIVLPPEQMYDSLARGVIDGYCVGEPWNTLAVMQGAGSVVATGYHIWNNAPEKVLGVTENWHRAHPGTHARLRLALMSAAHLLRDREQREQAAEILSRPEYLGLPVKVLAPSLTGDFCFSKGTEPVYIRDFHVFWLYQAGFPWRSHAETLMRYSSQSLGRSIAEEQIRSLVQQCYRTDLYREAARYLGIPSPGKDVKTENRHAAAWEMEPGIAMGSDMMITPPQQG